MAVLVLGATCQCQSPALVPMPQSIPKGLTREHVLKALADLDAGIDHRFGKPTGYELVRR